MLRPSLALVVALLGCTDLEEHFSTAVHGPRVRVTGHVAPGSLAIDTSTCTAKLVVEHDGTASPVRYAGCVLPDTIVRPNAAITIEGRRARDGVLDADVLLGRAGSVR